MFMLFVPMVNLLCNMHHIVGSITLWIYYSRCKFGFWTAWEMSHARLGSLISSGKSILVANLVYISQYSTPSQG